MAAFGIVATHPTASRSHTFAHAGTPTGKILEVWKGATGGSTTCFYIHSNKDVIAAAETSPALATTAVAGFFFIPSCAGTPTGVPANFTAGRVALVFDSTNNKLYAYDGAWIDIGP